MGRAAATIWKVLAHAASHAAFSNGPFGLQFGPDPISAAHADLLYIITRVIIFSDLKLASKGEKK